MRNISIMTKVLGGVGVSLLLGFSLAGPAAAQEWIQLAPTGGPPDERHFHTSVYNTVTNRMIVFGGSNAIQWGPYVPPSIALRNDVWVLSNSDGTDASPPTWTQLFPTGTPPSKRALPSAVYDSATNRMIVFGGNPNLGGSFSTGNEVRVLSNADGTEATPSAWTQLFPTGGPPSPRWHHTAGYDPATNRMIVFGEFLGVGGIISNEVWVLSNANGAEATPPTWTQFLPTGTPPPTDVAPRTGVYDRATNRLIVLTATSSTSGLNGVRVLENANGLDVTTGLPATPNWVQIFPTGGPPSAEAHESAIYDPATNQVVIFGGVFGPDPGGRLNEVWALTNANGTEVTPPAWTQLSPASGPPIRRNSHSAVYNPASNRMIVFGGQGCVTAGPCTSYSEFANFDDTWVLTDANGLPANQPPVAEAGPNQSIHVGQDVLLDGSGSSDDSTPSEDLVYAWSFSATPEGSTEVLTNADTVAPNFYPDLPGDYVVSLVVTDEATLSSDPDEVTVSSLNTPPTADAGSDQGTYVENTVVLDGSASNDPEFDPISYAWSFSSVPAGSSAVFSGADSATPEFIPDIVGTYVAQLIVSDGYADSTPGEVNIAVITPEQFAEGQAMGSLNVVSGLSLGSVTTKGNQTALGNFLLQVIESLQGDDLDKALKKLGSAIERTDGCALRGSPDAGGGGGGNPPAKDYVNNCTDQAEIYPMLVDALDALTP